MEIKLNTFTDISQKKVKIKCEEWSANNKLLSSEPI